MRISKDRFWTEDPSALASSYDFIPALESMTLEQQLNAITRSVLAIVAIMALTGYKNTFLFLLLALLFIIILYYIQKNTMQTSETYSSHKQAPRRECKQQMRPKKAFCNDAVSLDSHHNNPNYISANQHLAGKPNPKTMIPPVIAPRITDLDHWKTSNLVPSHSAVNETSASTDMYRSGYNAVDPVTYSRKITPRTYTQDPDARDVFTHTMQPGVHVENSVIEPIRSNIGISETVQFPPVKQEYDNCGNVMFSDNSHDSSSLYNNSNNINSKKSNPYTLSEFSTSRMTQPENVYDPRHTGYGTSYRSYTDDLTGQTRYYYDDVDAARMPDYITRNHMDHTQNGDTYGPQTQPKSAMEMRQYAQDEFDNNALQFRTELQERQMRKHNARAWQQRVAPIRTTNNRMAGGMRLV